MFPPHDRRLGLQERVKTTRSLIAMFACIGGLHIVGWFVLIAVVVPQYLNVGTKAFGIGVGLAAYMLGVRHAFDADHIAAIDNTTRRLMRGRNAPIIDRVLVLVGSFKCCVPTHIVPVFRNSRSRGAIARGALFIARHRRIDRNHCFDRLPLCYCRTKSRCPHRDLANLSPASACRQSVGITGLR